MPDRMYKGYPKGAAPDALGVLAEKIRAADAFVFVTGEYNWGPQPGLKNLTDHFLEEWIGAPRRSPVTRLAAFRAFGPGPSGTASSPRWAWSQYLAP